MMNYKLLENAIDENKFNKGVICKHVGISTQGLKAAIKKDSLKVRILEGFADFLKIPISDFFDDEKVFPGSSIKGNYNNVDNGNKMTVNEAKAFFNNKYSDLLQENSILKSELLECKNRIIELLTKDK